jgi:hypothetical protein
MMIVGRTRWRFTVGDGKGCSVGCSIRRRNSYDVTLRRAIKTLNSSQAVALKSWVMIAVTSKNDAAITSPPYHQSLHPILIQQK